MRDEAYEQLIYSVTLCEPVEIEGDDVEEGQVEYMQRMPEGWPVAADSRTRRLWVQGDWTSRHEAALRLREFWEENSARLLSSAGYGQGSAAGR